MNKEFMDECIKRVSEYIKEEKLVEYKEFVNEYNKKMEGKEFIIRRKEVVSKVFKRFEKEYLEFEYEFIRKKKNELNRKSLDIEDVESEIVGWILNFIEMNGLYCNKKEREDWRN